MGNINSAKLQLRNMVREDFPQIVALSESVYGKDIAMTVEMLNGQMSRFAQGQFVIEADGIIVGHCATFIIDEKRAFAPHSYAEITGGGFASQHDDEGDYLYGMEVAVDENFRGLRIGQRLYNARKDLCNNLGLKGIVFGGRMPNFAKHKKTAQTPENYINLVIQKKIKDPVIGFQIKNDFEFVQVLENYIPSDHSSDGYAALMVWHNPYYNPDHAERQIHKKRPEDMVRVVSVQFQVRKVDSFEEFASQLEYFVDVASDYRGDFILFPEFVTIPLISINKNKHSSTENIEQITAYTQQYIDCMQQMAISYNINIIGGTHPTKNAAGDIENMAYIFLRDGSTHTQPKIHITPAEKYWRNINGGNHLSTIETDCGTIGVLVCYDSEFPELARHLTDQGMKMLFVPFCTDEKQGYNRVRYCSQARAVENQIYVVMAGTVGNLPDVANMDINYAESCILTPCDFPFARDGIAATSIPNTETVVISDLNLAALNSSRKSGSVQNLKDRRLDLYQVKWHKK